MFLNNKYTKWYLSLVNNPTPTTGYVETHHIIPKCLGGTNHRKNLVSIPARVHYICHKLLTKMVTGQPKYKMLEALSIFSNNSTRKIKFNSRDIAAMREANSIASSIRNKGNQYYKLRAPHSETQRTNSSIRNKSSKWVNNGTIEKFTLDHSALIAAGYVYGRLKFSDEQFNNMRAASALRKGTKLTEEVKHRMSAAHKGKPKSDAHRASLSLFHKSKPTFKCPYCEVETIKLNYVKWHGESCKFKPVA